jgi:hypothetical protein
MSKNMVGPEGPQMTAQYGALDKKGYTRKHTPTRPGTQAYISNTLAVFLDSF